jgi:hypothetical protein
MNKNNYRPASKTESSLDFKKVHLLDDTNNIYIYPRWDHHEITGSSKSKSIDIGTQTDFNFDRSELIINKLIMFMLHLFLITMFELVFFFNYVTKFEDSGINGVFDSLTGSIISSCSNLNKNEKTIVDDIFKMFVNTTQTNQKAQNSYNSRMLVNNNLMIKAITYFIVVFGINIMLICGNKCTINKRINYKEIIIDNLIMITLLGIYEYIFFSNIIFKYLSISTDEIFQNFQNKFIGNC